MDNPIRQWPDNICAGPIRYERASNYEGFSLSDAMHGIPTFGAVSPTDPLTIRGQSVRVFNYPAQTEAIAAQLVHRWNAHESITAERDRLKAALEKYGRHSLDCSRPRRPDCDCGWESFKRALSSVEPANATCAAEQRCKAALEKVFAHPLTHLSGDMETVVREALSPATPTDTKGE